MIAKDYDLFRVYYHRYIPKLLKQRKDFIGMVVITRCRPILTKGIGQQRESIIERFVGPKGRFNAAALPVRRMI